LSKQKPQEEVLESKPSTASSDEEKLAAGISTIGLQVKRLSGAQRKKLVRERKMEGTWMVEKPKRKTPPSQDKGTAGCSRGCEKTPLRLEYTIPRKAAAQETQVQTGTYKEAAFGIKMVIVRRHHPDVSLDQAQTDITG
jgi:hypothetical protein